MSEAQRESTVRTAYDTVADSYDQRLPDTCAESPLELAVVDAFADAVGAGLVLDAGCGTGRLSRYLASRGCRTVGLDLSAQMLASARRRQPELGLAQGSLLDLPFVDDSFGGVLLWYSPIHTPPEGHARLFAEAARVLAPGGHVLVGFQSGSGVNDVAPRYRELGYEVELVRYRLSPDEVAAHLAASGIEEVCRLVRRPEPNEVDDQACLLARLAT